MYSKPSFARGLGTLISFHEGCQFADNRLSCGDSCRLAKHPNWQSFWSCKCWHVTSSSGSQTRPAARIAVDLTDVVASSRRSKIKPEKGRLLDSYFMLFRVFHQPIQQRAVSLEEFGQATFERNIFASNFLHCIDSSFPYRFTRVLTGGASADTEKASQTVKPPSYMNLNAMTSWQRWQDTISVLQTRWKQPMHIRKPCIFCDHSKPGKESWSAHWLRMQLKHHQTANSLKLPEQSIWGFQMFSGFQCRETLARRPFVLPCSSPSISFMQRRHKSKGISHTYITYIAASSLHVHLTISWSACWSPGKQIVKHSSLRGNPVGTMQICHEKCKSLTAQQLLRAFWCQP